MYCSCNTHANIVNNTIAFNQACYGGGVYFELSSSAITNSIIYFNDAYDGGDEIVHYQDILTITYSDIGGGFSGEGNININPYFRYIENDNFRLMSAECGDSVTSPCIDAGRPEIEDGLLSCFWGQGTSRSDMGAYGGGPGQQVNINNEIDNKPENFSIVQNYPNPFNPTTSIKYSISQSSNVQINIYQSARPEG